MKKIVSTAVFGLCCVFSSAALWANAATASPAGTLPAETEVIHIGAVEYIGNKVTRKRLLDQQLYFSAPAEVSGAQLSESLQAIRDLGLFESVVPELVPAGDTYTLKITIDEKFYIIPLPRLGLNSDGETSYGASVEWDNLAGLNQRIKFVWERKQLQNEDLGERQVLRLQYDYPRVAGSLWNAGFFTRSSEVPVDEAPEDGGRQYNEISQRHGLRLGRQLSEQGQTHGWFVDGELFYLLEDRTPNDSVPELQGGSTWALGFAANFRDTRLLTYTDEGVQYGLSVELSIPVGNPDYSYNLIGLDWRLVTPGFNPSNHHSMIYRAGLGIYNGGIPEQQVFGNNSNTLRGLSKGELEGNAQLYGSLEYLLPINSAWPTWRYGVFVDAAVFADDYTQICLCDISYSVGIALAWRPRKLVKVELRGEYGYNLDSKTSRPGGGLTRY